MPLIRFSETGVPNTPARAVHHPKLSVTQTYMVAHQARGKLAKEARCADHNLHRLVCHANMLDTIIEALSRAEAQQQSYIQHLIHGTSQPAKTDKWTTVVREKFDEDSDSEEEEESESETEVGEEEEDDDSDDEYVDWELETSDLAATMIATEDDADDLQEECVRLTNERNTSTDKELPATQPTHFQITVKSR